MRWFFRRHRHSPATPPDGSPVMVPERRYRGDVPYALPKDLDEGDRLNVQHYLFRLALKGNYVAPLESSEVKHVLDVGSGTGLWGREMAHHWPHARIFGLDLEPPQTVSAASQAALPPPNYHFLQGNVLKGLPFPDHTFDYVHMRMLCAALPDTKVPFVLRELRRVTKPDGYVELLEVSTLANPGPKTGQIFTAIQAVLHQRGMSLSKYEHLAQLMWQAGFLTPIAQPLTLPIGWGGRLGQLLEKDTIAGFLALKPRVCEERKIDPETFDGWMAALPRECRTHQTTFRFMLAYAKAGPWSHSQ